MRFSSIQQIDPIIAAADMRGMMGGKIIIDGFRSQFPKLLDPNKPKEIQGFTVVRSLGVANRGGAYPTVQLAAIVYAAYGMAGVVYIPFAVFSHLFAVAKKALLGYSRAFAHIRFRAPASR
jgi:hypothetical protein